MFSGAPPCWAGDWGAMETRELLTDRQAELAMNLRKDFTITEKAQTSAFLG